MFYHVFIMANFRCFRTDFGIVCASPDETQLMPIHIAVIAPRNQRNPLLALLQQHRRPPLAPVIGFRKWNGCQ
jgi:hypothetical protein